VAPRIYSASTRFYLVCCIFLRNKVYSGINNCFAKSHRTPKIVLGIFALPLRYDHFRLDSHTVVFTACGTSHDTHIDATAQAALENVKYNP